MQAAERFVRQHMHCGKWLSCTTRAVADDSSTARVPQTNDEPLRAGLSEHWDMAALAQAHRHAAPEFSQVPSVNAADVSPEEFYSGYVVRLDPPPPPPRVPRGRASMDYRWSNASSPPWPPAFMRAHLLGAASSAQVRNVPVCLRGAAAMPGWPAAETWSDEGLKGLCGHRIIKVRCQPQTDGTFGSAAKPRVQSHKVYNFQTVCTPVTYMPCKE